MKSLKISPFFFQIIRKVTKYIVSYKNIYVLDNFNVILLFFVCK